MRFEPQKFDDLLKMAKSDPDALERYRQSQIDALIGEAPQYLRQRLEGLQFQIDAQRSLHNNPMGSCIKINQMMHESFSQLQTLLQRLSSGDHQLDNDTQKSAKVLPFTANS